MSYLHQGISKTIYPRIFGISKAKDAWETLKKEFQGNSKVVSIRLQSLWKNFDCLTMKESESIKDFFSRVTEIVNQIRAYGDQIEEKKIVEKILGSLPPKFDHAAAAIEESKDLSILTIYDLCGSLESHEERMKRSSGQSLEQAFQSKVNLGRKIQQKRGNFQHQDQFHGVKITSLEGVEETEAEAEILNFKEPAARDKNCIICKKSNHTSDECYLRCKRCRIPNHSD